MDIRSGIYHIEKHYYDLLKTFATVLNTANEYILQCRHKGKDELADLAFRLQSIFDTLLNHSFRYPSFLLQIDLTARMIALCQHVSLALYQPVISHVGLELYQCFSGTCLT